MGMRHRTGFEPMRHGLALVNRFERALSLRLPVMGRLHVGSLAYGLCGGMCFAALDYYHAGLPVPAGSGGLEALSRYLHRRQWDSIRGPAVPWRTLVWSLRGDAHVAALTRRQEWPRLRAQMERGEPAVLVLMRSHGWRHLTSNHQVVAVACEEDEAAQQATLWLYDPNYPGQTPTLRFDLAESPQFDGQHSTGETDRAFFVQRYRPRRRGLPT